MITIKSDAELEIMKQAGVIVAEALQELAVMIRPGITTAKLDQAAEKFIIGKGAQPAFKGYRGFPASICASVNEEVVHGIPSLRRLREGDIVSIDMGSIWKGFYGDAAITVPVGMIDPELQRLLKVTEESLYKGIEQAKPGAKLGAVSHAIQRHAETYGFSVVRDFVGHGIGRRMHEDPQVPNYGSPDHGPVLKPGMTIAIEPMLNMGVYEVEVKNDMWTVVTRDGKCSAHFEHTIAITDSGAAILTSKGDGGVLAGG
ncbi:MAG: type I methionyl aminopeptidase [Acidobacteriota bacterium]